MDDGKLPGQCCSLLLLNIFPYMWKHRVWEAQTNTVFGKHRLTPCLDAFFKYFAAISRSLRYIQPSHYLFRVECVSALMNTNIEKYESGRFEAGGYKWWVYFQSPFLYLFFFFLSFSHEFFFPFFFLHLQEIVYLPKREYKK